MHVNFRDEDFIFRVLGIDNGTSQIGMSVMDYDLRTGIATVVYIEAFNPGDDAYEKYPSVALSRGNAAARIKRTKSWFRARLEEFNPHAIGCESPFAHLHPPAYAALLLSIDSLIEEAQEYRPSLDFIKIAPGSAKKAILHGDLKYSNDKELVRTAILSHPCIQTANLIDLRVVSADESDSVAVGWCVAKHSNTQQR